VVVLPFRELNYRVPRDPICAAHRRTAAPAPLLLGCLLGAVGAAHAVTLFEKDNASLELYGILDVGLGYLEHSYSGSDALASTVNSYNLNSSPHSFSGLYTGGVSMSRVGLKGEYGFGTGEKVFCRLESAINVTTGMLSNNGQAIYNNIYSLRTAIPPAPSTDSCSPAEHTLGSRTLCGGRLNSVAPSTSRSTRS